MDESGVYNSTTVSYENSGGNLSMSGGPSQRRPWSLSEVVSPPGNRSYWTQWMLLMGGSVILGLGLIVVIIGVYNQNYYSPESHNVVLPDDDSPPNHWMITLTGFGIALLGIILLVIYCKMVNSSRFLCNPLSRTRDALRQVVTKPRYHPGRPTSREDNLLSNDGNNIGPMTTQYNPVQDIGFRQTNGDVNSEEKANLMANEMKEGIDDLPSSSCEALLPSDSSRTTPSTNSLSKDPRIVLQPFSKASTTRNCPSTPRNSTEKNLPTRTPSPPLPNEPPLRPPRRNKFSSLRRDVDPYPGHYKARHFAGHGYRDKGQLPSGISMHKAPLASLEDITPSLRSSFASVMMYPPSDWGNSSESFDSTIMVNLTGVDENDKEDRELSIPDSEFVNFNDFRVSPARHARKSSLSSLSVQSALT